MKKRMAFVSSYDELCGNATFTKVLADGVSSLSGWETKVFGLDLVMTQSADSAIRRKADIHIREIAKQLRGFDAVNIQFEGGLYGYFPADILNRLSILVKANPCLSVTVHSPRLLAQTSLDFRQAIKNILFLRLRKGIAQLIDAWRHRVHERLNYKIVKLLVDMNIPIHVFTQRSKRNIKMIFGCDNVHVHPIKFLSEDYAPDGSVMASVRQQLALKDADKTIGMFGFVSDYKGHTDALKALTCLPDNYKLLIFGRQHPQTIRRSQSSPYIQKLIKMTHDLGLRDRAFFMGELSDEDFASVAASVDVCWLPYYETGQDGSGITSICLDASPRVLCSAAFSFDELFKLSPYRNVMRFDIGNYAELASKTSMILNRAEPQKPYTDPVYTLETQAKMLVSIVGGEC